jgi:hypothetical protein
MYTDKLICHICAVMLHLSPNQTFQAGFLAAALKKEISTLCNYFKEIGASYVPTKNSKTNESDFTVSYAMKKSEAKRLTRELTQESAG